MEELAEEFGAAMILLLMGAGLIRIFAEVLTWVSAY